MIFMVQSFSNDADHDGPVWKPRTEERVIKRCLILCPEMFAPATLTSSPLAAAGLQRPQQLLRAAGPGAAQILGSKLNQGAFEAAKWRTDRAKVPAGKAGCLSKGTLARDGSHLVAPKGFDQNGPLLRWEGLRY
ncbi:hypothetical protein [Novosphingobium sp. AAP93]|uniref:hypothetical protein n=1 Tax=Novosphingobium sp. AAP93 TaxID=1523427 RepID=UPI0012E32251|nr:hypothetical protein [Novosphingobium sp. AAP93]